MVHAVKEKTMIGLDNVQSFLLDDKSRERIKFFIKDRGLSQRKIAEMSEGAISYGFIAFLLCGKNNVITKQKLEVICDILHISPEMIFSDSLKIYSSTP